LEIEPPPFFYRYYEKTECDLSVHERPILMIAAMNANMAHIFFGEPCMRKLIAGLILVACACALSSTDAAYVIKLKNGNEFVTGRYWQEGKQVLFDTYGGVFGVDKAFVITIQQSDKPVRAISASPEPRGTTPQANRAKEDGASKKPSELSEAPTKARRDNDPIMKDFYALKEKFAGLDGMLTSEIIELSKDLSDFKRRVQTSGKSNDYLNEFAEAFKMGNALESALKSRSQ
jgi:hypothetical protein